VTHELLPAREATPFRGGSAPVQRAPLRVSSPEDAGEREAVTAAGAVMRMSTPVLTRAPPSTIQRATPAAAKAGTAPAGVSGGEPLPVSVRRFMEPRFNADFAAVRIHTDAEAARAARHLGARAFTTGNHIYFGAGQYQPETPAGLELIAHELAHTVQQGAAPRSTVQRSADLTLTAQPQGTVQRLGLSDILDGLADLAANVPGYTLLTLIIGRNPINMRTVERTPVNVLRAFMGLIPGGELLFQILQRYGVIQRIGDWIVARAAELGLNFQAVRDAFNRFTDSLGWRDIFSPGDVWTRARNIFTPIIDRITSIVGGLVSQAITWLKETFMQPLSEFCRQIPGYGLVTVLLGRDPFTGTPVPRTALNVVRAFAEFIPGGTEKVNQLVESGALQRAYDWFITETTARNLTWARVTGTFASAWASLRLEDVLHPIDTLQRMIGLFRPLLSDLVGFAGAALLKLLELIYEAAMGAGGRRILAILTRARSTFVVIIRNPVGFLRNLLGAVGQGVRQFMGNILAHLRDGVIAWLTGPVARAGVQMPERWDVRGIIWFVLQILGLTWARVREKLVRLLGERVVGALEAGFQLLQEIREKGLVQALRDRVSEFFGNLRDSALGAIRNFIQQRLVMAGITQLLSLLNPVGAIIQAIIKTYTTVQFFIQRINQILDLVESVVNSIAAIAAGAIGAAANFVERTMARTIPVILDFLARFIGLGDVAGQVTTTIRNLQGAVDRMLDRAVDWIRNQARNLASRAMGGDPSLPPATRLQNGIREGTAAVNRLSGSRIGLAVIRPVLAVIRLRNNMQRLDAEQRGPRWAVVGVVNPTAEEMTQKLVDTTTAGAEVRTYEGVNAGGFGRKATIRGLNRILPQNQPSVENPNWSLVTRRLFRAGAASYYYVRGHLLNGTFGGPGNDWRNLTPLTQTANNRSIASMLSTFERPVRDAVDPAAGGTADVEVTAVYASRGLAAVAQRIRTNASALPGRSQEERNDLANLIAAEEFIPTQITANAVIHRSGQADRQLNTVTENIIDTDLSRYWHAAHPPSGGAAGRTEVNVSSANSSTLQAATGIDASLALRIVAARPSGGFRDRDDFTTRLGADGASVWHRLSSTAGIRLVF
jgi:hypothetical protein